MTYMTHTTDATAGLLSTLRTAFAAIALGFARRAAYAKTRRELEALSDHELQDIGITRFDIDSLARKGTAYIF